MKNKIINRKLDKELDKVLNRIGRTIDEYIDFADIISDKLREKYGSDEHNTPIFTTFMHILNMADSISVLVKKGNGEGIKPLVRSLFETFLYFEYFIKEEPKKGILAYQVAHANHELSLRKMFDHEKPSGQKLKEELQKELNTSFENKPLEQTGEYLQKLLQRTEYTDVNQEFNRLKKQRKGNSPNWYNIYTDLKNLRELASYLNKGSIYSIIYKELSGFIHGGNTLKNIKAVDGEGILPSLRSPEEVPTYVSIVLSLLNFMYKIIDTEDFPKWYANKMRDEIIYINSLNIKVEYIKDKAPLK